MSMRRFEIFRQVKKMHNKTFDITEHLQHSAQAAQINRSQVTCELKAGHKLLPQIVRSFPREEPEAAAAKVQRVHLECHHRWETSFY